jgi:SAM-dependent methyltransferase/predicted enzyme related to lactoylglutathione lyase
MQVKLTSVFVTDQEKALDFYTEALGFVKKLDLPMGEFRWLTVVSPEGGDDLELLLEPNAHPAAHAYQQSIFADGIPAAAFAVTDLDAEFARLSSRGVVFPREPMEAGETRLAVFDDTCGNLIQLYEEPAVVAAPAEREGAVEVNKHLMYDELASWWPLLSAPEEYVEEAGIFRRVLAASCEGAARTVLELGSGGGNNAFHLKAFFDLTLVDLSPGMLEVSRALNPECEHFEGDMRSVRLARLFDCVFVHDAVSYMTCEADLRGVVETAFAHCRPGGGALFVPDYVRESFAPATDCGGHDGDERGLRYLDWVWDPDPDDDTYLVDYAYLLRDEHGQVHVEHERHVEGVFATELWLRLLRETGFEARTAPFEHSEVDPGALLFVCRRPPE